MHVIFYYAVLNALSSSLEQSKKGWTSTIENKDTVQKQPIVIVRGRDLDVGHPHI